MKKHGFSSSPYMQRNNGTRTRRCFTAVVNEGTNTYTLLAQGNGGHGGKTVTQGIGGRGGKMLDGGSGGRKRQKP